MKTLLSLLVLLALSGSSFADEIRKGAIVQVKPNSIWFQDAGKFNHWRQLKKSGNAAAFASYQEKMLVERDAWQFTNTLTAKILSYEPAKDRVKVQMKTEGRILDTTWFLEPDALAR